jgi:hypothetical protein
MKRLFSTKKIAFLALLWREQMGQNGGEYGAHALPQASGKWLPQIENEMALRDEEAVA